MKQSFENYIYESKDRRYNVKTVPPTRVDTEERKKASKSLYDIFIKYEKNRK